MPLKRIDNAAKAAATRGGTDVDRGYRPGAIARSMVKGSASRFPARGQLAVIRPYRKNLLGSGEEKIRFDVFCEGTQTYIDSCYAFASPLLQPNYTDSTDTEFDSMTISSIRRF
jgi:hypothetical protein